MNYECQSVYTEYIVLYVYITCHNKPHYYYPQLGTDSYRSTEWTKNLHITALLLNYKCRNHYEETKSDKWDNLYSVCVFCGLWCYCGCGCA